MLGGDTETGENSMYRRILVENDVNTYKDCKEYMQPTVLVRLVRKETVLA